MFALRIAHNEFVCTLFSIGCSLVFIACASPGATADNWPQWRGPHGDSVSTEHGLPVEWSETQGVVWKAPLPEWGTSTPAIWGDAIFLTTQVDEALFAMRLDKQDGHVVWSRQLGSGAFESEGGRAKQKFHRLHNMASPSPVTDGRTVVFHFGNGDLAALDFDGQTLWQHNLQKEHGDYTIWWGHANSPLLYGDLVISVCMQDSLIDLNQGPAPSYLVAHNLRTGAEVWKRMRMTKAEAEQCDSYTTPILRQIDGRTELIVMGGNQLDGYDPANGEPLWSLSELVGGRTITGPTAALGLVFATRGMRGPILAVDAGRATPEPRIVWQSRETTPDTCCPVVYDGLLFMISDNGIATCFDARTGKRHWQERLSGDFKASPLAADGHVYFLNLEGLTYVVEAASEFKKAAENQLDDETTASPAIADGRFYIRGRRGLYCLARP